MSPAAAKKPIQGGETGPIMRLMREMGATSFEPLPTDQLLAERRKRHTPDRRLLAELRATTIRDGHHSAYAVDEAGKPLTLADLSKRLGMDWSLTKRAWDKLVADGYGRNGGPKNRWLYLCGKIDGADGGAKKEGMESDCTVRFRKVFARLTPTQRKAIDAWPTAQRERFLEDFEAVDEYCEKVEADAIKAARRERERIEDSIFAAHGLEKKRLEKDPAENPQIQLEIFVEPPPSVQQFIHKSVQTDDGTVRKNRTVQTTPSLLTDPDLYKRSIQVGRSVEGTAQTDLPTDEIRELILTELAHLHDLPSPDLCRKILSAMGGAPLEALRQRILLRMKKITSLDMVRLLAQDVGTAHRAVSDERRTLDRSVVANMREEMRKMSREERDDFIRWAHRVAADDRESALHKAQSKAILWISEHDATSTFETIGHKNRHAKGAHA